MKKEIKNFEEIIKIILIILTFISLIINALQFTNIIYNSTYDTTKLNNIVISKPFTILLFINNILIYITSLFYIICAIESKKEVLLKISFSIFSILTTIVASTLIINFTATIFGVF